MHPDSLRKLEARLYSQLPLIGKSQRRRAAEALARDGSPAAVQLLAEAMSRSDDKKVLALALESLRQLNDQHGIDAVCAVWVITRHPDLTALLTNRGWVASSPAAVKVLSALKLGRLAVVTEGGTDIVEPLLQAFSDADAEIANRATEVARLLKYLETQEELSRLVISQDHPIARQIAVAAQYAPRDPNQQALFYFLTEQWDKYDSLDFEHTLLQTAYEVADEQLRKRIAERARQAGRVEWVRVVTGGRLKQRLEEMTHAEWETTLTVLSSQKQWEEIWRLAQVAPVVWSVRLLQQLKEVEWVPKEEQERAGFTELMQLAGKCEGEVPDKLSGKVGCWATLRGHTEGVNCIAISSDRQLLVTGSSDKTMRLWHLPDGKPLSTLREHTEGVNCVAISPDVQLLATGSSDKMVRLWHLPDGKPLSILKNHTEGVSCLAISPDGRLLASGSRDKTVRLWRLPDGKPVLVLRGHTQEVNGIAISPDGRLLASGSRDKTVRLWRLPDGEPLQSLGHTEGVNCVAISPDGQLLASGRWRTSYKLRYRDVFHNRSRFALGAFDWLLKVLFFGSLIVPEDIRRIRDETVQLWRLPDGKPLSTLYHYEGVSCLAISPDGQLLASGNHREILLRRLPDGKLLQTLRGHFRGHFYSYSASGLAISSDGRLLARGQNDTVELWISELSRLSHLPVGQLSLEDIAWVQEGLHEKEITKDERNWRKFLLALIDWQRRFDIEVEDAPQQIDPGTFDIEIEG